MKRFLLGCISSGLIAAMFTTWMINDRTGWSVEEAANAQQLGRAQPDTTLLSDVRTVGPAPTRLTDEELTNIHVYETASRSVVNIDTRIVGRDRFFMMPTFSQGSGSGTVIDQQGHVLTNFHVVEGAREIQVTLSSGSAYDAEITGYDAEQDLAVLKIDAPASELYPITVGGSDDLKVGQRVYALGNPFGLEGTITTGIISSLNRTLASRVSGHELQSIIQTDAAMNPGNSGGPLLDTSGRMIGMNVAIATKTGQNAGLGFAIPISRIRRFVPELIAHGKIARPYIGIVKVFETDQGLQIVETNEDGPAAQAGLRGWRWETREVRRGPIVYRIDREDRSQADIIIAVDGEPITSGNAFIETIEQRKPGDVVRLTILRQGRQMEVPVKLGTR